MNLHCCQDENCEHLTAGMNLEYNSCNKKYTAKCLLIIHEMMILFKMFQLIKNNELIFNENGWKFLLEITGKNSLIGFNCHNCLKLQHDNQNQLTDLMSQKKSVR